MSGPYRSPPPAQKRPWWHRLCLCRIPLIRRYLVTYDWSQERRAIRGDCQRCGCARVVIKRVDGEMRAIFLRGDGAVQ